MKNDVGKTVETAEPPRQPERAKAPVPEVDEAAYYGAAKQTFESQLKSEPHDVRLAQVKRQAVKDLLVGRNLQTSDVWDVNCGSSLCRYSVRHQDRGARDAFVPVLGTEPFDNDVFFQTNESSSETTVFVALSGHALPKVALADLQ